MDINFYFPKDSKYGVPIQPSIADVVQWLEKGKVIDIRFYGEREMASLIRELLECRNVRLSQRH